MMKTRGFVLMLLAALLLALLPSFTASAQCAPQQSWGIYYVKTGETLALLASRFSTTEAVIYSANCLTSSTLFAGQSLHVPPGRIRSADIFVGATFQSFQGGFMVWSADSSAISVFTNANGRLTSFSARTYSRWAETTNAQVPPAGFFRPMNGFGKVWNARQDLRDLLGWATSAESGYTMLVFYDANARVESISLPGGVALLRNGSTWRYGGSAPPAPIATIPAFYPTPTPFVQPNPPSVGAAYQPFEGGFMFWRADTGDIYTMIYATGDLFTVSPQRYASLSINYGLFPPPGRYRPENGFGRWWSNAINVRGALGWATAPETGYVSVLQYLSDGQLLSFTLPNGGMVTRVNDRNWSLSGGVIVPPPPVPTFTPLPPPNPTTVQIAFQCFQNGFMIWRADNSDVYAMIWGSGVAYRYLIGAYGSLPDATGVPPAGLLMPINAFGKVWANFTVRNEIGYPTRAEQGLNVTLSNPGDPNFFRIGVPGGGAVDIGPTSFYFPSGGNTVGCP
jgi:LysM repeat protein